MAGFQVVSLRVWALVRRPARQNTAPHPKRADRSTETIPHQIRQRDASLSRQQNAPKVPHPTTRDDSGGSQDPDDSAPSQPHRPSPKRSMKKTGGEGGIRTHGRVTPTHAFQACSFGHSDTSPPTSFRERLRPVTRSPPARLTSQRRVSLG